MQLHEDVIQLGWDDDEDYGELLLDRIIAGAVTVLYEPVDLLGQEELRDLRSSAGSHLTVVDEDEEPRVNLEVVEVFETTWGAPDERLVAGDGFGDDVEGWKRTNEASLRAALEDVGGELTDDTAILVQQVRVTEVAPD